MKIGLIGLPFDDNLGDPIMIENIQKIIRQKLTIQVDFVVVDLLARDRQEKRSLGNLLLRKISGFTERYISEKLSQNVNHKRFIHFEKEAVSAHFKEQLQDCDIAIVVGGGIVNFRTNRFVNFLLTVVKCSEQLEIPCILNALGIEQGFDLSFPNCQLYQRALNNPWIRAISTRDHLDTLKQYVTGDTPIALVADSACFTYPLENGGEKNKSLIGIGIIRPEIFDSYKNRRLKTSYINLINSLIVKLKQQNEAFQIFTNGNQADFDFARSLKEKHELADNFLADRPQSSAELKLIVASYKKILCSRLHAAILAYSADTPVMGIDWNGKLKSFGNQIYQKTLFYYPDEVTADKLLAILYDIDEYKWTEEEKRTYLETEIEFLQENIGKV